MPIMEIHLLEGRTTDQKDRMARAVTQALVDSLDVPVESVRILVTEHHATEGFYVGGMPPHKRRQTLTPPAPALAREETLA
ncbi:MAG: tautomerase family protein [Rhodospirillum sp.]|nr:tautomerase family protein [Rhodospirillum sp.]MCF8488188.1 tautomerase family protein [Rhodospirillum sp.]MCF8501383.1 tautomerase family protein [Rhodospirillum sp.]